LFKKLEPEQFFDFDANLGLGVMGDKFKGQSFSIWLCSFHRSLLLVTPSPLSSRLFCRFNACDDIQFIVIAHVGDWWLWCSSRCCNPLFPSSFSSSYSLGS